MLTLNNTSLGPVLKKQHRNRRATVADSVVIRVPELSHASTLAAYLVTHVEGIIALASYPMGHSMGQI